MSFSCLSLCYAGNELLYRTREGDVVRLNVETMERVVLVPNKIFVSPPPLPRPPPLPFPCVELLKEDTL